MIGRSEDNKDNNDRKHFDKERGYPTVEIAEARIKQSLLRYKITVEKAMSTEKEKVRL